MTTTNTGARPTKRRALSTPASPGAKPPAEVYMVDPPWQHRDTGGERGARAHYVTMSTDEICTLPVPPLAERSVLVLWRLANMAQDALNVCRAWCFEPVSEIVWEKLRPCQTCAATGRVDVVRIEGVQHVTEIIPGTANRCPACHGRRGLELVDEDLELACPAWLGMGRTVRTAHETAIIARPINGRAPERLHLDVRSYFAAPMVIDVDALLPESEGKRGALVHSAKPEAMYRVIERLWPGPYVEGFTRRTREGWSAVHSNQDGRLDRVIHIMREEWPMRVREERLASARKRSARAAQ